MTKAFVRAKLPACDHYVITTCSSIRPCGRSTRRTRRRLVHAHFARDDPRRQDSRRTPGSTFSPGQIVRERYESRRRAGTRVSSSKFVVYGLRKNARHGNCILKDFSEEGFVEDLASARAVVCNGGLSLIGEAVFLGKPIFSVPVGNQYEQVLNGRYLEELGWGLSSDRIDADVLGLFLGEVTKYAARVGKHRQEGNRELFDVVDHSLERFARKATRRGAEA